MADTDEEEEDDDEEEEEVEPDLAALTRLYQTSDTFGTLAWKNIDSELRSEEQSVEQVSFYHLVSSELAPTELYSPAFRQTLFGTSRGCCAALGLRGRGST